MVKGIYTLVMKLCKPETISVGKVGTISFSAGYYVYVGSAFSGLEARLTRHLRKKKKLHWHIDYFLKKGKIEEIVYSVTVKKKECTIAMGMAQRLLPIPNFGCSDCRRVSHLYFASKKSNARKTIKKCFAKSELTPYEMIAVSPRSFSGNKLLS